jgi:hypothetical protein
MQQENMTINGTIDLLNLEADVPLMEFVDLRSMANKAAVALEQINKLKPPKVLSTESTDESYNDRNFRLTWTLPQKTRLIGEEKKCAEKGAIIISFALITQLTDYMPCDISRVNPNKPTGIDYWLCKKDDVSNFFAGGWEAAMEVSGTNRGKDKAKERMRKKKIQVQPTLNNGIIVYIVIVSFKEPMAKIEKINPKEDLWK